MKGVTSFAKTNYRRYHLFGIKQSDRLFHMHIIGKTGTGKTTCLETQIRQDIDAGRGIALIDPHGDLVERVYAHIPRHRMKDVIYLNIPDLNQPWGYNPIQQVPEHKKPLLAAGIIGVFQHLWKEAWGARLEHILRYTILALLDQPHATFNDLLRLLLDQNYQQEVISHIKSEQVRAFWVNEFPKYGMTSISPLLNKIGSFLAYPTVRRLLIDNPSNLSLRDVMDSSKILLVNLSHGQIGSDAAHLIGSLMITSLGLAAFSRANIPESERKQFMIYADEFQHFTGSSVMEMLSELRKYKVGLVMAHQYFAQLSENIKQAIIGNVGTLISFRLGQQDAAFMAKEMEDKFEAVDFSNLPNYDIYLRLMIDGRPSRPFSATTVRYEDVRKE